MQNHISFKFEYYENVAKNCTIIIEIGATSLKKNKPWLIAITK